MSSHSVNSRGIKPQASTMFEAHAGDELVARAVERLMTPEGWSAPVKGPGKRKPMRRRVVAVQGE